MTWQPIATAPKDGTEFLLWRADSGPFLVRWIAPSDFLSDNELRAYELSDCADEPDWFFADFIQGGRVTDGEPTHWMPLPEPPEQP